jgi:alanyl-tRNA synthetase
MNWNSPENTSPLPLENRDQVQQLLKKKACELLLAQPQQVPELQQEIQKLRIVHSIFKEIENDFNDPNLYKEMNLLNRMMVGKDLESEAQKQKSTREQEEAATKLKDSYGMSPEAASRVARVIASIVGGSQMEDLDDEPEPPKPIDPSRIQ